MNYELKFEERALKEWEKLNKPIREQFKKKLAERIKNPHVLASRLKGCSLSRYKIKLRTSGYRLVYEVNDAHLAVLVIAIGKREDLEVYKIASRR